ncbi:uncharacterized protein LOC133189171 isoform X2 [Saccostrea echinata]|uniref:uncharacterized protein LOC133189171 isoform X2 n=1 Tax=Saccostrea echinata TaxID=191078 RepID=UPI002A7EF3C1|nr:uncharacterized protein LOC133189171 isoform X2 [Saccostrea echinata]
MEMLEKELNSFKETLSKLDQANKTEMLEKELNSVKETLSKFDQANETEMLEKELNSVKETLTKLDQANKTEMLEKELNSVKETLSKFDQANETEMLEKELNSVKETLSKFVQANKTEMLEKELNSVEEALSKLNQSKLDQAIKTEMLEKELNSFKETLSKLDQANETEMLEKELNSVKETLSKLYQSKLDQAIKTEMLEREVNSVKEALSILRPDHVAFHVVAYRNSRPGVIIFDHVITNNKFGYDRRSGIFTVPITGLYVFSWSIETYGQLTVGALFVNGLEIGMSMSDQAPTYYDTTTSFAVLNLTRKDNVWIRIKSGRAEAMHTMFSGWMINKNAFYASLSRDVTGSPIIFNNEILDTDDAYSTSTGKFVAPHTGLYVLIMSGLIYERYAFNYTFSFGNGISQPKVGVHSTSGYNDSSSYMTFAWMNTGESVYIDAKRMGATSMFAGWLLIDDRNVSKSTFPAFLAHINGASSSTPVVYNTAHSGYHHGYSTSMGVFTADRDGLYLFLYNTEGQNKVVRTALRVNGVEILETRTDGRRSDYDDTSAVTVLQLSSNDRVSIGIKSGTVDDGQSLFFGILLFEI